MPGGAANLRRKVEGDMTTGIMGFNSKNGRYGILVMDLWEIEGFHCGDILEVWDYESEQWISTRIEMYSHDASPYDKWYLVGTPYSGFALEGLKIRVR